MPVITTIIERDFPIEKKVGILQDLIYDNFFHPCGIIYSHLHWKDSELRPFQKEDFEGQSYPKTKEGFTPWDCYNNEDSPMASATFLMSQCMRFKATGEEQAREYSRKGFRSIDEIFKLTEEKGHRGYLCKPYGRKVSNETSPDQYCITAQGLWAYREIADKTEKERIDYLLPAMADWWLERNYRIVFFDSEFDILNSHWGNHFAQMACLNYMAYSASKGEKYFVEYKRLLELAGAWPNYIDRARARMYEKGETDCWWEQFHGYEYDSSRKKYLMYDGECRSAMWYQVISADFIYKNEPSTRNLLKHAIARCYKYMQFGLTEDTNSLYNTQIDLEKDIWKPLVVPPTPEKLKNAWLEWAFCAYQPGIYWNDAVNRLADVCVIAHQYAKEFCPGALCLANEIFKRLDDKRLYAMTDADGKQFLPELYWMKYVFSSHIPSLTALAYWRARVNVLI